MRITILPMLAFAFSLTQTVHAQQVSPLTLHAQAKLVVVDVVVTDHDHHPIHSLKQQDFSILEAHAPQTITSFEEHTALTTAQAAKFDTIPPLPLGTFSNFNPAPTNTAINILLLDTLNTAWVDQTFVRSQLLDYLKHARPGANVAIFGLSTHLVMLQGFTTNPDLLRAVAMKQNGKLSPLLDDPVHGGLPMTGAELSGQMGGGIPASALQPFLDIQESVEDSARARYTLDAMNILAHFLSAIPGRKNLIWFSGGFPLNLQPNTKDPSDDPFIGMASFEAEYRETARLLASSQVAVYPVDARGLMIGYGSGMKDMKAAEPWETMQAMAEDTGGRAFIHTNGLAQAVDEAIEDGSSYYTISYRPTDQTASGRFRKSEIKLAEKGYLLEYRRGYYEDDPKQSNHLDLSAAAPDPKRSLIFRAMEHGVPESGEIIFKARVLPTDGSGKGAHRSLSPDYVRHYAVDFAVLPTDIAYTITSDGLRHFNLEFVTVAYRSDSSVANRSTNILKGSLTPAQFARLKATGFPYHQEINVPVKGDYSLRLGVHDIIRDRVGTTEIPVASVRNLQQVGASDTDLKP